MNEEPSRAPVERVRRFFGTYCRPAARHLYRIRPRAGTAAPVVLLLMLAAAGWVIFTLSATSSGRFPAVLPTAAEVPTATPMPTPTPMIVSDDWRQYVVGPASRDVLPRNAVGSQDVRDPRAALLADGRDAVMSAGSTMIVDFGQVVSGKVELVVGAGSGRLDLSFSESFRFLKEGSDESHYGLGDISYTPPAAASDWTSPHRRTFRYLMIRADDNAAIDAVRLYFTPPLWPDSSPHGLFLGDDDLLNRIWYHGVYTLQLTTASGTVTDADGTWEPVRGQLDVAGSSVRGVGLSSVGGNWRDYTFSFKLTMAPDSSAAGWVFRATEGGQYLWELVQTGGGNQTELHRLKGKEGSYVELGATRLDHPLTLGQQVTISMELTGATIVTRIDGVVVDTTLDPTYDRGAIGFRAVGSEHFYVDDVRVTDRTGVLFSDDFSQPALDPAKWSAAQPTVLLDGAKRDRAVGTGDTAIAARTYYAAGGDPSIVRNILVKLARYQYPSGRIPGGIYGVNMAPTETPDLKDYALWWILVLRDYVLETGDLSTLRDLAPALDRDLAWAGAQARPDGLLDKGKGLDWYWTWPDRGGSTTYFNDLYVGSLDAAADMYRWLGRDPGPLLARAVKVTSTINSVLWDPKAGAYVDSDSLRTSHPLDGNALAVYFGVASGPRADSVLSYVRRTMWCDWGSRTSDQPIKSQYHNETIWPSLVYYEVAARFRQGDVSGAYDLVRRTWGNMLNVDPASTFWEFAGPDGQVYDGFDSLAHGWSTGPVSLLTRRTLGIRPLEPGYTVALVAPQPGPVRWAQGSAPTPLGPLAVKWHRDDSIFSLSLQVPAGMQVVVGVPAVGNLLKDGSPVSSEPGPNASDLAGLDPSPRLFLTVGPGTHTITSGPSGPNATSEVGGNLAQ